MKKKKSSPEEPPEEPNLSEQEMTGLLQELLTLMQPAMNTDERVLHQLPEPPADWLGRATELAALQEQIESGVAAGVVLHGPAGVGKTALALKLAAELSDLYCDAQFYFDLESTRTPAEAMAHVLHAYQPPRVLPESVAELRPRYAAALRGQRTLLLLDNVAEAAQLEPLLPPAGCVLLVTAAQPLELPGLFNLPLDSWPAETSSEFLLQRAPELGKHAVKLAELCGGLPLALRLIAGVLTVSTTRKLLPATYTKRLAALRRNQEPLAAALALADDLMPFMPQGLWRELAVFPASFAEDALAAIWEMTVTNPWELPKLFHNAVGNLVRRGVLEKDAATARYRLHEAARALAKERLEDAARAGRLHAQHYLEALKAAVMLYKTGERGRDAALMICDMEWANFAAGRAWAVAHAATDTEAAQWATDYFELGIPMLIHRLRAAELQQWLRESLAAAKGDAKKESELLGQLGSACQDLGEHRRSVGFLQQAVTAARASGNERAVRRALGGLADAYHAAGTLAEAIPLYQEYLTLTNDPREESFVLNNLGAVYGRLQRSEESLACFQRQLEIARALNDRDNEGRVLTNFGILYITTNRVPEAIDYFQQALAVQREHGPRSVVADTLRNLGGAYLLARQFEPALATLKEAEDLQQLLGNRSAAAEAIWNQAMAYDKLGQSARAIERAETALKIFEETEDPSVPTLRRALRQWRGTNRHRLDGH